MTSGAIAVEKPDILRAQHEKRLREARQRQHTGDGDDEHVIARQSPHVRHAQAGLRGGLGRAVRLVDAEHDQRHAEHCRHHGDPERGLEVASEIGHRRQRQQRSADGADGVERLAQAEAAPTRIRRRDVGDQRIARRATNALAHAIGETRTDDPAERGRQRKRELGDGRKPVAEQHQWLAFAKDVGDDAGEELDDQRKRFRHALDDADDKDAGAERRRHVERQQRMDQFRRQVHAHADQAQHPYAARHAGQAAFRAAVSQDRQPASGATQRQAHGQRLLGTPQ